MDGRIRYEAYCEKPRDSRKRPIFRPWRFPCLEIRSQRGSTARVCQRQNLSRKLEESQGQLTRLILGAVQEGCLKSLRGLLG